MGMHGHASRIASMHSHLETQRHQRWPALTTDDKSFPRDAVKSRNSCVTCTDAALKRQIICKHCCCAGRHCSCFRKFVSIQPFLACIQLLARLVVHLIQPLMRHLCTHSMDTVVAGPHSAISVPVEACHGACAADLQRPSKYIFGLQAV